MAHPFMIQNKEHTEEIEMQEHYNFLSLDDRQLYHRLRGVSEFQLNAYKEAKAMIDMFNEEEHKTDKRMDIHNIRNWRGGLVSCIDLVEATDTKIQINKQDCYELLQLAIDTNKDKLAKVVRTRSLERRKLELFDLGVPSKYLWRRREWKKKY